MMLALVGGLCVSAVLGCFLPFIADKVLKRKAIKLAENWNVLYDMLSEWVADHDGSIPSPKAKGSEGALGKWLERQKASYDNGLLRASCFSKLAALKVPWTFSSFDFEVPTPSLVSEPYWKDQFSFPYSWFSNLLFAVVLAAVFGLATYFSSPLVACFWVILVALTLIFVIADIRCQIAPDEIMFLFFIFAVLYQLICFGTSSFVIALGTCFVVLFVIKIVLFIGKRITGRTLFGQGDVKYLVGMSIALSCPALLYGLLAYSFSTIIVSVSRRIGFKQSIPAAPYLGVGLFVGLIVQASSALV